MPTSHPPCEARFRAQLRSLGRCGLLIVAAIVIAYLASTLTAAMRSEEAHLREKFGDAYDAYAQKRAPSIARTFSWARAVHNREHHTIAGLLTGLLLMVAKIYF